MLKVEAAKVCHTLYRRNIVHSCLRISEEMLRMKLFLKKVGQAQLEFIVHCDDQSAIHLSKNSSFHSKSKHINIQYHWI